MIAYNEQELIYLYHLGSMRAYEILLSEYRKFIYAYANRYDSGIEYSEEFASRNDDFTFSRF